MTYLNLIKSNTYFKPNIQNLFCRDFIQKFWNIFNSLNEVSKLSPEEIKIKTNFPLKICNDILVEIKKQ